ncbi:hypothetical protein PVAP13_2NG252603 [Panicum virgatum]|uniref:Uncharacterized protein n=1 Tax=Panicum virgatum TaxID=38727 RepID=A0A8T0VHA9_PANVG|nr:hypothetical protein PVAP13_2NG252603 [Panicum virgatum]
MLFHHPAYHQGRHRQVAAPARLRLAPALSIHALRLLRLLALCVPLAALLSAPWCCRAALLRISAGQRPWGRQEAPAAALAVYHHRNLYIFLTSPPTRHARRGHHGCRPCRVCFREHRCCLWARHGHPHGVLRAAVVMLQLDA